MEIVNNTVRASCSAVMGEKKLSQEPAVRDNRGTPPHPAPLPRTRGRGFFRLPFPLAEGWGEGAFPRIDAKSCYDVWCVPSFETVSHARPTGRSPYGSPRNTGSGQSFCDHRGMLEHGH